MHGGLQQAKYEKNIEIDLLLRVALLKFLTQEISTQFANLMLEAKEWIRGRGDAFRSYRAGARDQGAAGRIAGGPPQYVPRTWASTCFRRFMEIEENGLARSRKALFGDESSTTAYDILNNRLAFVEGGKDDVLFLEQYVLLGNYLRDQDRFETFDALLLDFLRESVLAGDQGSELSDAWREHQKLVDAAVASRAEIARLEEERAALARKLERSESLMGRVGFGSDPATLRAAITDVEKRLRHARHKLEESGPRIEAARGKADYLAKQYQERLGDYLNQPENARRLFDPNAPGEARGECGRTARAIAGGMDRAARAARFARAHSGQLPVAEHLPRLLPADPLAAIEKGAGVARGIQARRGHPEAVSRAAVFHAAHRRTLQENPQNAARRGARRRAPLRRRLHAAAPRHPQL